MLISHSLTAAPSAVHPGVKAFIEELDEINSLLGTDSAKLKGDLDAYYRLLVASFRPHFAVDSTTRALLTAEVYDPLSKSVRQRLNDAMEMTLVRYSFRGLDAYDGQQFRAIESYVDDKAGLGWVKVEMQSPRLAPITFDILLRRIGDGWQAVDGRFQGITYVTIKKYEYRLLVALNGVNGLIADLESKNREFFQPLCQTGKLTHKDICGAYSG